MDLGVVVHIYNPSIHKPETGESWVWGQPSLLDKTLSLKKEALLEHSHTCSLPYFRVVCGFVDAAVMELSSYN
jgi:hypothetical protein